MPVPLQLAPLPGSPQPVRDETHPLVTLLETAPHSLSLLIRPRNYHPDTMVGTKETNTILL